MFDVQSNTGPSSVSVTSIVTVRVPSLNVPSSTGSTLNSVQLVPSGASSPQVGLSSTRLLEVVASVWAPVAPAYPGKAPTRITPPATIAPSPDVMRHR